MNAALFDDYCSRHGVAVCHNVAETDFDPAGIALSQKDDTPLARGLNVIVPVSFAETGGYCTASCYGVLTDEVSAHLHKYRENLFSDAALEALDRLLRPHLDAWGYEPSRFAHRWAYSCIQDNADNIPRDRILPGTVRLSPDVLPTRNGLISINSLVSMNLSDCAARGAYAVFADDRKDTVVCIASVNRTIGAEHCTEIGVECAPAYRRRGYAVSCVAALARELVSEGKTVLYQYYHTNTASAAVARCAGFVPAGRFFTYSAFRKTRIL